VSVRGSNYCQHAHAHVDNLKEFNDCVRIEHADLVLKARQMFNHLLENEYDLIVTEDFNLSAFFLKLLWVSRFLIKFCFFFILTIVLIEISKTQ